ncbi:hypothetical protein C7B65_00150 [Phormidesmis priestleyi ULC007]|uniref:Uncharacterized protein n=1 Tax=Phormidesmis priestleyi ULC007 TaxID=1920490 RepID=A0A2T1DN13_9CYAN|nr:hypothetical protein C7B65_00150 [Phormidesmis priestleyi ULC007]PZO50532.1 MAG: hypothetical protein DCF14_11440 [Phormidesmis priestleyi]
MNGKSELIAAIYPKSPYLNGSTCSTPKIGRGGSDAVFSLFFIFYTFPNPVRYIPIDAKFIFNSAQSTLRQSAWFPSTKSYYLNFLGCITITKIKLLIYQ